MTSNLRHRKYTETTPLVVIQQILNIQYFNKKPACKGSAIAFAKKEDRNKSGFVSAKIRVSPRPKIFVHKRYAVSLWIQTNSAYLRLQADRSAVDTCMSNYFG